MARPPAPRRSPALPLAALVLCHAAIVTADSHSMLPVLANVLPVARFEEMEAPHGFVVTEDDVQRGYVNVREPMRLRVYSNSREGYQLDVHNLAASLPGMTLRGLGGEVELGSDGGTITQRWHEQRAAAVTLRFRFRLPEGMSPGTYPWPVRLRVRPL